MVKQKRPLFGLFLDKKESFFGKKLVFSGFLFIIAYSFRPNENLMRFIFPNSVIWWPLALGGLLIAGCERGGITGKLSGAGNPVLSTVVEPEVFTEIPIDLRGCGCLYARDSVSLVNKRFIYANDMDKLSVIRVNGYYVPMLKTESRDLNDSEVEEVYVSGDYRLNIRIRYERNLSPSASYVSGLLQLIMPTGRSREIAFVGRCGF